MSTYSCCARSGLSRSPCSTRRSWTPASSSPARTTAWRACALLYHSIGAIGGSITAGSNYAVRSGATHLYHHKLLAALDAIHPVRNGHSLSNGGVPGTGPTYMEHCVHDHMPRRTDLLLVEYATLRDTS